MLPKTKTLKKSSNYFIDSIALQGLLLLIGYAWVFFNYVAPIRYIHFCYLKTLTGYPCPSCGTTRAIEALLHGNLIASIYLNPLGIVLFSMGIVLTLIWFYSVITRQNLVSKYYLRFEQYLKMKSIALLAIALVLANWIWNIYKCI